MSGASTCTCGYAARAAVSNKAEHLLTCPAGRRPAAPPAFNAEAKIQRNRERKARRFVERFLHQMRAAGVKNPETDETALKSALETVRNASQEQWAKLAADMGEKDPPSGATVAIVVTQIERAINDIDYRRRQAEEDREILGVLAGAMTHEARCSGKDPFEYAADAIAGQQ